MGHAGLPLFVSLLLLLSEWSPLLRKAADTKWGGELDYEAYRYRDLGRVTDLQALAGGGEDR